MRYKIYQFLVVAILTMATHLPAHAADEPRKGGLLLTGESLQWITTTYEYTGHDANSSNAGSRSNKYEALYHISKPLALVDPHLLKLNTAFDLKGDYNSMSSDAGVSSSDGKYSYQYNMSGAAFDRKWYPISFHTSSTTESVMAPMAATYDNKVSTMGANISLIASQFCDNNGKIIRQNRFNPYAAYNNMIRSLYEKQHPTELTRIPDNPMDELSHDTNILPIIIPEEPPPGPGWDYLSAAVCGLYMRAGIEQSEQETTGGTSFKGKNNNYNIYLSHNYKSISSSIVDFTYTTLENISESSESKRNDRGYALNVRNSLKNSDVTQLDTLMQMQNTVNAGIPQTSISLNEVLSHNITPNLLLNVTYDYNSNSTLGVDGGDQTTQSHAMSAELQHRTGSFTSRLRSRYSLADYLGGGDTRYAVMTGIGYKKDIGSNVQLTFDVIGEHENTERHVQATEIIVRDELHSGVHQQDIIVLNNYQQLNSVTKVMSRSPDIVYQEGIDYMVDLTTGKLTILPLGHIDPDGSGMDIFITYIVPVNASAKYGTDTLTVANGLSLFAGKLTYSGLFTMQNQKLISGQSAGLNNTRIGNVRIQANLNEHTASAEYHYNRVGLNEYQYIEGEWQSRYFFPRSSVTFQAKDRYTVNSAVGNTPGNTDNTFSTSASYSRAITDRMQGTLSVNFVDNRQENTTGDFVFLKAGLLARWGKLQANITAQTTWRMSNQTGQDVTTRDDFIHVQLTRYF